MVVSIIYLMLFTFVISVQKLYTHPNSNTFGDFSLGAGFDINRYEPKAAHVFRESKSDLFYDIMPLTSTKTTCSFITRQKDIKDKLKVVGSLSISYASISGSGQITFDQKKERMNRVAYYSCSVDRTLYTISVNAPEITAEWPNIKGDYIPDNLLQLETEEELQEVVGDYHIRSITYGRRWNVEIRMEYSSEDAFELISGELKADIGFGALSVSARVNIDKQENSYAEDLTLTVKSEALGFIEERAAFLPTKGTLATIEEEVEKLIADNLRVFNKLDTEMMVEPETGLSKKELFTKLGTAYPLWYTVEKNFPYFQDSLTRLTAFEEEQMLRNIDTAYDILRELEDMTENIETRAQLLFETYHLLSGATELSTAFLNYRQKILDQITDYRVEAIEYLEQRPIELANADIYSWASAKSERFLQHTSMDVLSTKVWDLLGMDDVPMNDGNPIGSRCLFNGVQAIDDQNNRIKYAGRVIFGDLTVRHVLFDTNGKAVSLGYIDHKRDNRDNKSWDGIPHEIVFVREDCTLLKLGSDVWYQNARYTISSIGSKDYLTPRGYVNKEKLTNIRIGLIPQDTTRDIELFITNVEVKDIELRGSKQSNDFAVDSEDRLLYQNGYVCDSGFKANEAKMICTHLGYANLLDFQTGSKLPPSNAWGRPRITMVSLDCPRFAFSFHQCAYKTTQEDPNLWNYCGVDNGVILRCSNNNILPEDTVKMKVIGKAGVGCVRDSSAKSQRIDTVETCSGGDKDEADDFGSVEKVSVIGDICVKLYRDDELQCVVSAGDNEWDFSQRHILTRFCYDDALKSTKAVLPFPESIVMMPANRVNHCRNQDELVKDMSYRSNGTAIPVVDCESGKKQGLCSGDKLSAADQRIFQEACTRSCEECQINPRTHYQVKVTSTEDSFALNGAEKIPVDITLRPESNKDESSVTISRATETVFADDIACGSQLQLIIKPKQPYDQGDVDCVIKVISELGRMDSDGKVIMAGDLELTFTCINPHNTNTNPPSNEDSNPSSNENSYFFDLVSSHEFGRMTDCASMGCSTESGGLESCRQRCEDHASCNVFGFCPESGSCPTTNRCCIRECSESDNDAQYNLRLTSRWGGWNVYAKKGSTYEEFGESECYASNTQYSGDRIDNPLIGSTVGTADECKTKCDDLSTDDSHGRRCVAFEHASQDPKAKVPCMFAWDCSETSYWAGGKVYRRTEVSSCSYSQTKGHDCLNFARITLDGFRGNDVTVETCQSLCTNQDDCVKINYYVGGICTSCGVPSRCYLISSAANSGCNWSPSNAADTYTKGAC